MIYSPTNTQATPQADGPIPWRKIIHVGGFNFENRPAADVSRADFGRFCMFGGMRQRPAPRFSALYLVYGMHLAPQTAPEDANLSDLLI